MHTSTKARRAAGGTGVTVLARAGLVARGVIYLLIGWVALLVAFGRSARQPNQQGALELLAHKPYGLVSLWLLGVGFACYAIWRLSQAAFDTAEDGRGAIPRLKCLGRAAIYGFFAYLAFAIVTGSHGSQTRRQQDVTAQVMHHPGGRWLVGIGGLAIVVIGVVLVAEGLGRKFMRYLRTAQMSRRVRQIVERLGVAGSVARGAIVALIGVLIVDAAVTFKPAKSGGLDTALLTLRHQPYGQVLLVIAALGLITFGVYGLCEARWRRV